ncbi:MAG TPA: hypothetical protein VLH56_01595 [Dissulfurispiraceae bacterium]|nr:hypothetical protein [Dissulfurispiraceae bacterium]
MTDFYIGQHCNHPDHGAGTLTFIGSDYVGIELQEGSQVLVRKETFLKPSSPIGVQRLVSSERASSWPESTFVRDDAEAQHYHGSHWQPFFDDVKMILEQLPVILKSAEPWVGGSNMHAIRETPSGWTPGITLVWPNHRQGLMLSIETSSDRNSLISMHPFVSVGGQHHVRLLQVNVWENGLEAQIEVEFGETTLTFFDVAYTKNRLWYEAGRSFQFIISGIAYDARPSTLMETPVNHHPDEIAWQRQLGEIEGKAIPPLSSTISLRGMAMFLHIEEWDRDDYSFRGPIKEVRELNLDILGQTGWFVKVTAMRFNGGDADLDFLITQRVWQGTTPPSVGQDIEGSVWLQGYLWCPPTW